MLEKAFCLQGKLFVAQWSFLCVREAFCLNEKFLS